MVMNNDVARAFFEAPVRRPICVELPREAVEGVGRLRMSLYGTRDAAANFQEEVKKFMVAMGFRRSVYNPSMYHHEMREIKTLVHGDDFASNGRRQEMGWFRRALESRFDIKTEIVDHGTDLQSEARVLSRVVRAVEHGWEYEPDQRHAELFVKGLGWENAKAVKAPGMDEKPWEEEDNARALGPAEASRFRSIAARCNYLALVRADIQ